jgi:hypothetical protein
MWTGARPTVSIILAVAAACGVISAAYAAPQPHPHTVNKPKDAKGGPTQGTEQGGTAARGHTPTFRPARGAAAADAKRPGALAGKGCTGRAEMPRNEHQWVVLCSNGKTFVVEPPAPQQAATPPVACSLAGTGPEEACFP